MNLLNDIEILKIELLREYEKCGELSHPKMIAISKSLDEKIFMFIQKDRHPLKQK